MESSILVSIFVILCVTVEDISSENTCRMRYCNDMSATMDMETASENKLKCQCDDWCWRRQDCCLNYLNKTNVNDRTHYFGIPKAVIERGQLHQCQHINPNETFYGYSMISKCGTASHQDTDQSWQWQKSMCEQPIRYGNNDDLLLRVPVSSYATGETYRNIYCAACHDDLENIVAWNTSAICYGWYNVSNLTDALHNMYGFNKDDNGPKCYLNFKPQPGIKSARCLHVEWHGFIRGCPAWFLNSSTSAEDSDRRREIEWLCQVTRGTVRIDRSAYENLYCAACHLNETDIGALIEEKHGNCLNVYGSDGDMSGPLDFKSFAILMDFNMFSKTESKVGMTKRCSDGYIYDAFTEECRLVVCSNGICQGRHLSSGATADNDTTSIEVPSEMLEEFPAAETNLNCTAMQLDPSEGVVNENGTLTVNHHTLYQQGNFEIIDNDTIFVCVDLNDNDTSDFKDYAHVYMTFICSLLSLIALALKMIIFALIPEIRRFSDRSVFCLSASLFIAQLLFLIPTSSITDYIACASVGVLTHYFFLSSFSWMNVLAYDVWNTLSQCIESRSIHSDILNCRFYRYSVYAWVTPMLIVSAACVFDWSGIVDESSVMRPHYGVNLCWINTRTALLFYFAIPMALLLLSNIVFFVLTAVSIRRSSIAFSMAQMTQNSQQKQSRSHNHLRFSIYVKLAVIMGLTWISGFVAAFSGYEWLWYVFTLISASQGVYILIALTPCKNVIQKLQLRFKSTTEIPPTVLNTTRVNHNQQIYPDNSTQGISEF